MATRTARRCYSVDPRHIGFIKFILEAYDNVAVLSTANSRRASIEVAIAPGCETLVDAVMADLARGLPIRPATGNGDITGATSPHRVLDETSTPLPGQRRNKR